MRAKQLKGRALRPSPGPVAASAQLRHVYSGNHVCFVPRGHKENIKAAPKYSKVTAKAPGSFTAPLSPGEVITSGLIDCSRGWRRSRIGKEKLEHPLNADAEKCHDGKSQSSPKCLLVAYL